MRKSARASARVQPFRSANYNRSRALAAAVRGATGARREGWVLFDNTAVGHAIADAARLQALLADRRERA